MKKDLKADLERIAKELGGELHEMLILDSKGISKRKVSITYPDNK